MDPFFCGWSIFEPEDIGWSHAVVERSRVVRPKREKGYEHGAQADEAVLRTE